MPTVMVTFVQATYICPGDICPNKQYLSCYQSDFDKTFWTQIIIVMDQKVLGQNFFQTQNFIRTESFQTRSFIGPKNNFEFKFFSDPTFFRPKIFFRPKFFFNCSLAETLFRCKLIFSKTNFQTINFQMSCRMQKNFVTSKQVLVFNCSLAETLFGCKLMSSKTNLFFTQCFQNKNSFSCGSSSRSPPVPTHVVSWQLLAAF